MPSKQELETRIAALRERRNSLENEAEELQRAIATREDAVARAVKDGRPAAESAAVVAELRQLRDSLPYRTKAADMVAAELAPLEVELKRVEALEAMQAASDAAAAEDAAVDALDAALREAITGTILPLAEKAHQAMLEVRRTRGAAGLTGQQPVPWYRHPELRNVLEMLEKYAADRLPGQAMRRSGIHLLEQSRQRQAAARAVAIVPDEVDAGDASEVVDAA